VSSNIETRVRQAKEGHRDALEDLVMHIQDRVYGLSLRMLGHPADAEDASQEILIKVITHLDSYREESAFTTWVYRVAANHLLSTQRRRAERMALTFALFEEQLQKEQSGATPPASLTPEQEYLVEEERANCMQGTLLCLSRDLRLAFILGVVFGVTSQEGAYILDTTPETFRKRVSRGRAKIQEFMLKNCGLVNPGNPCQCARILPYDIEAGWIDPKNPLYATRGSSSQVGPDLQARLRGLDEIERVAALFKTYPEQDPPPSFVQLVKELLDSRKYVPPVE
jgi:RNA polymerase sigma factor (sigma-70 family)